ncbi:MAG TPA: GDSL-type esterase/lipase family protein [Candidatus Paceibacterota bacterium]|nr:GDSL-type esterase/lipase family protein [Candidatus Paceibacterota bacterium]
MLALGFSEYSRFILTQTCIHWKAKFFPPKYVFIGDSITAGGRNWGWIMNRNPFSALNLGKSSYMVWQVKQELIYALSYHPQCVLVLAGTNDLFSHDGLGESAFEEYGEMLKLAKQAKIKIVVTLVPYQANDVYATMITQFNERLIKLCHREHVAVIDLNPIIAPHSKLLPEYTVDGIHFSEKAYEIWKTELLSVLKS